MANDEQTKRLDALIFAETGIQVYALIDGASVPELLSQLHAAQADHCCLFSGDLEPDHAAAAPYLVKLDRATPLTKWLLGGWGQHWGVYLWSHADLRRLRKHFRQFLMVKNPRGASVYFRFYDPRVLGVYLRTLNTQEMEFIFGPVVAYLFEGQDRNNLVRFMMGERAPKGMLAPVATAG